VDVTWWRSLGVVLGVLLSVLVPILLLWWALSIAGTP